MKKILVTGGCGFIGHHFVEHILKNTDWHVVIFDKLSYASQGYSRIREVISGYEERVTMFSIDLTLGVPEGVISELDYLTFQGGVDYIIHFAAESHVERSIQDPVPFVLSNILGTVSILNFAKRIMNRNLEWFVYFGTDEVFGPAPLGMKFKEWDRYNSTNPYSATKAGAEEMCLAYANCYKIPLFIIHSMNVFGERQHPEKFIPMCIKKILNGETITIHADETKKISGSRFYIHARNVSAAIMFLLKRGRLRDKFNVVGEYELDNLLLAQEIAKIIDKPFKYEMVDFHSSRPGHDLRYALDGSKMEWLGWKIPVSLEDSLKKTVLWTLEHPLWLEE